MTYGRVTKRHGTTLLISGMRLELETQYREHSTAQLPEDGSDLSANMFFTDLHRLIESKS